MANFNQVVMAGHLTKDPEVKELASGDTVCNFRIAVNSGYKEKKETLFIDTSCWNNQAINCGKYLKKGRNVMISGRLKQDEWQDSEGNTQRRMSIVAQQVQFLNGTADGSTPEAKPAAPKQKVKPQAAKVEQPAEDEIPF